MIQHYRRQVKRDITLKLTNLSLGLSVDGCITFPCVHNNDMRIELEISFESDFNFPICTDLINSLNGTYKTVFFSLLLFNRVLSLRVFHKESFNRETAS